MRLTRIFLLRHWKMGKHNIIISTAQRNMSIEDVTTEIRRGKHGQRDFVVTAEVVTSEPMDLEHM
jgi:hypothetical protein